MANPEDVKRAKKGKKHWNDWAAQNLGAPVNFSHEDLTGISFASFEFPGSANFNGITISGPADFHEATFFGDAYFGEARFTGLAHFGGATFLGGGFFHKAKFSRIASFRESKFSGQSDPTDHASFSGVTFSDDADFTGARFSMWTHFEESKFSSRASFMGATFLDVADFSRGNFSHEISFHNASFEKLANFSDCTFDGQADFQVKSIADAPRFHGVSVHKGIQFGNDGNFFTDFVKNGDERSYQALRLSMGQQQARTEEAAFAALELKARRYRLKSEAKKKKLGWQRFLSWAERCGYWLWEKCSKSGRGFLRPLTGYLLSWGAFTASYVLPCRGWRGDWWAGIHYAFLKQFPFAAAFRGGTNHFSNLEQALFAAAPPPGWVTALNSAQSLFALTLIFLMGLGIRHKFRLR
ncbi:MAG: pentapeptide repeat-containing protein [Deltaproteobacteria bacterium]|nr:pentapeptide repeat-containing protein [Deltaproteobacteria bacterium]